MVKKTDNQLSSNETKHLIMVFHYQIFRSLCKELPRQSAGWAKLLYMFFTEKKYQLHFFSGEWEVSCCKKATGSRTKFNRFYMSRTYSFGVNKDKRILAKGQVKISLNQFQIFFFSRQWNLCFRDPICRRMKIDVLKMGG